MSDDTAASPVGSYTIMAAQGTLTAQNYTFSFATGTLGITPATLVVTAADASRTYGDADPAFTVNYSGFVNGQTLAGSGVSGAPAWPATLRRPARWAATRSPPHRAR